MSSYFETRMAEIRASHAAERAERDAALQARMRKELREAKRAKKVAEQAAGYVYFLRAGNTVKIGFTVNPKKRFRALSTGISEPAFICKILKGGPATERKLHERFAEYRMRGEWFDLRGALAKYLELHIKPIDLPERAAPEDDEFPL